MTYQPSYTDDGTVSASGTPLAFCDWCGAVVADQGVHDNWHNPPEASEPEAPEPDGQSPAWDKAAQSLADHLIATGHGLPGEDFIRQPAGPQIPVIVGDIPGVTDINPSVLSTGPADADSRPVDLMAALQDSLRCQFTFRLPFWAEADQMPCRCDLPLGHARSADGPDGHSCPHLRRERTDRAAHTTAEEATDG